ncbi:MAG: MBL fold metallo-hydrolase [Desulfobacteraceae bacterium]|nr:MAG: MBL fold metallo-hydrolase [Desulfobacteraceae bacterium]
MNISQPGPVTDRITLLGRKESCVYWVEDKGESVLLGGGMSYIIPDLLRQIEAYGLDERRIRHICILHSHFDHCGAVPFLKKRWPWAVVAASDRAKELLAKPQILDSIAQANRHMFERMGLGPAALELDMQFDGIRVEKILADGDVLPCGGLDLEVIETPGHSSCSISIYMAAQKALFASDAVGLRQSGSYQPTPNSNYDQYQQSLAKLAGYDLQVLLLEHYGAFMGEDAREFIPKAMEAADRTRRLLEETYRRTRDVEKCTQEITGIFMKRSADSFLSEEVRSMVAGQMVRYIAKAMEGKHR